MKLFIYSIVLLGILTSCGYDEFKDVINSSKQVSAVSYSDSGKNSEKTGIEKEIIDIQEDIESSLGLTQMENQEEIQALEEERKSIKVDENY